MRSWSTRSFRGLALVTLGLLAACGGGASEPGMGTLQVKMQDTPVDEAENVYVTVERVEVFRTEGGAEVRETLVDTPTQYDLLTLQNGVSAVLGTGEFPAGDYKSIRLIVAADSRQDIQTLPADQLNNYIVIDGVAYALVVPSGAQTGIKFNHHFTISPDEITVLSFDFDVRRSVHQRGHQPIFNLRPTLRLIDTVVSGTISGTVVTSDAAPLPAGTVVSAQQAGAEIASAIVDVTTGDYMIGPLLAGSYDMVVIAPGYGFASESGVAVVAQQDSSGPNAYGVIGFDANAVAPGRRMLSSMSPSFMVGNDKVAVLGAKGGSRIITMTLLGILGIEQGMGPEQIAAMPRFHHQYLPDAISFEPGALSPTTITALEAMGHKMQPSQEPWTFYLHAVDWDRSTNTLRGGADPRNPPGSATVVLRKTGEVK